MFKDYRRLVIFDTETSSLSPDDGEILELGAVVLTRPEGEERFTEQEDISVLIKNDNPIPWNITQINHIDDKMCEKEKITGKDYMDKSRPQTCRGMHSETNAISYSIRETDGATLYATIFPCNDCTKHIIANKIKRVVFKNFYNENEYDVALNKFKEAGVEVCNLNISFKRLIAIDFFAAKENANFGIWKEDEREEVREFLSPHL